MTHLRAGFVVLMLGLVSTPSFAQGGGGITLEVKFYIPAASVPTTVES